MHPTNLGLNIKHCPSNLKISFSIFLILGEKTVVLMNNTLFMDIMKGVIVSHILYEEYHVYNSLHKYFPPYISDALL